MKSFCPCKPKEIIGDRRKRHQLAYDKCLKRNDLLSKASDESQIQINFNLFQQTSGNVECIDSAVSNKDITNIPFLLWEDGVKRKILMQK